MNNISHSSATQNNPDVHSKPAARQQSFARRLLRWVLQIGLAVFVFCIIAILGLLGYSWFQHNQGVALPKPTGTYAVGRVGFDWVDSSRLETLGPNKSDHRELMVWIWYPASPAPNAKTADYLPDNWRQAREKDMGAGAASAAQNLAAVQVHAVTDAPLAAADHPFPVLVMQPGLGPIATDYTTLAEELASHGYIVVASTPTYSANVVVFQDGRVVNRSASVTVADDASPEAAKTILDNLINVWTADNSFIMNQLQSLNAANPSGKFTGHIDLQAIGVWGHSFGGASAAQTCQLDDRCKAGANLDGTLYGNVIQVQLHQPFMFIWSEPQDTADADWQQTMRDVQTVYNKLNNGGYQITIKGTRHFNFSDYAVLYEPMLKLMGGLGPIDGQRGLRITSDYLVGFFDKYLKGIDSPLLNGTSSDYPEAQFQSR